MRKKRGFTLIELMVTITIMIVLSMMGVLAFQAAQLKARNTRRISDIQSVQKAQEQYFTGNNAYVELNTSASSGDTTCNATGIGTSLEVLPVDPSYNYVCQGDINTTTNYCMCARLECTSGTDCTQGNSTGASCSSYATTGTNRQYYCLENQQ